MRSLIESKQPAILEGVRLGMTQAASARAAGVSPHTLKGWIRRGKGLDRPDEEGIYADFVDQLETAKAEAVQVLLQSIRSAAEAPHGRGWGAAAWLLSKLNPAIYGDKLEVKGEVEHRKTYRFEAPVIPEPVEAREVEAQVVDELPAEEGQPADG